MCVIFNCFYEDLGIYILSLYEVREYFLSKLGIKNGNEGWPCVIPGALFIYVFPLAPTKQLYDLFLDEGMQAQTDYFGNFLPLL